MSRGTDETFAFIYLNNYYLILVLVLESEERNATPEAFSSLITFLMFH